MRTFCFAAILSLFSLAGSAVLMAVALDLVSIPGPTEIASAYHHRLANR
jgi:hypothetical protein